PWTAGPYGREPCSTSCRRACFSCMMLLPSTFTPKYRRCSWTLRWTSPMTAASCSNRRDLIEKRAILACMTTRANSVEEYLAQYSGERRAALEAVRQVIVDHLNPGFEEGIQYGMIGYYVPHSKFPSGYHCDTAQPLPFASLGAQKHHMALYRMFIYGDAEQERFRSEWAKTGKIGRASCRERERN